MNHETEHRHEPAQESDQHPIMNIGVGGEFVNELATLAPSRRAARQLRETYERRGTPLALYLGLEGVDPYAETLEDDFIHAYIGYYQSHDQLIEQTLADLGLQDEFDQFIRSHPEADGLLVWDWNALSMLLEDRYTLVELGDAIYAYNR